MENILSIPTNESDHHRGIINSPVRIVQYGDYECPYCSALAPELDRIFSEYNKIIGHTYRHYPQVGIHKYAEVAALASEAAAEQGMFWEMSAKIYEHSYNLSSDLIRLIARGIGLDMNSFENDLKNFGFYDKIKADYNGAKENGVISTPTIFINEVLYEGSSSYWPLKEAIELALGNYRSAWF